MGCDFIYATVPVCDLTINNRQKVVDKILADMPDTDEKQTLIEALTEYKDDEFEMRRDVSTIRLDNNGNKYNALITGGMSGGDAPTDAFNVMYEIVNCDEIYKAIMQWAVEDYANKNK